MSINRVFLGGHVGLDPEAYEHNNEKFVGFSFAENVTGNGEKKAIWHQVSAGGKIAETILTHVKKGDKLVIEGRVSPDAYTNKENQVIPLLKIWLSNFEFASSKESATANAVKQ